MNKEYKVTVIIPTYNHASFLREAIQSVLDQTFKNWNIIVINNFSNDNTIEILESFCDSRIKCVNFSNNGIIAASRNVGLKLAKGDYIAFLDSDDVWLPYKLEKQLLQFEKDRNLVLCSTNSDQFPAGQKNILKMWASSYVTFDNLIFKNNIINSSVLIKKEVVAKVGLLDESQQLRAVEDYDYWLRIALEYPKGIKIIKDRLLKYRIHDSNVSGNTKEAIANKYMKINFICEKHRSLVGTRMGDIYKRIEKVEKEEICRTEYYKNKDFKILLRDKNIKMIVKLKIIIKGFIRKIWD